MKLTQDEVIQAVANYVLEKLGRSARIRVKLIVRVKGDSVEVTAEGMEE